HLLIFFFFSSRRRHTRFSRDWSSDVCSSDLDGGYEGLQGPRVLLERELKRLYRLDHLLLVDSPYVLRGGKKVFKRVLARVLVVRSEERRVGKECRSRGSP